MDLQLSSLPYSFPQIDQQQAQRQLEYLGYKRNENVYLRFFYHSDDPRKNLDKGRKLDRVRWQDVENYQRDGRGVYVVVNGSGGGHEDKDIVQCTAVFCEWDDRPVEDQLLHCKTAGFLEPTFTVYSGDKSAQPYWVFDELLGVEQWRELQCLLIEVMGADPSNKNPSRVFRLAGGWHVKPGREPVRTVLVQDSGKKYSYEEVRRELIRLRPKRQPERKEQQELERLPQLELSLDNSITPAYQRYDDIQIPVSKSVPLEVCLSLESRTLLEEGVSEGGRNTGGAKLARDLIGTANYLQSIGQQFDGDPRQLLDNYALASTPPLDSKEVDAIWKSALRDRPTPSCKEDGVKNCIKAWYWNNYVKPNLPARSNAFDVTLHPAFNRTGGKGNPPLSSENTPYALVKELVSSGMTSAQLSGALIELSNSCGYHLGGLKDLASLIEDELSTDCAALSDAKETNKLLEYREQTLLLKRIFPEPLANYLLTKATSDRVDPVFIYQYLWSAIGLSLGAHVGIEGKKGATDADSWVEFPIYYNLTVAPPSSGKSQTMRSVLGPIKRKQSRERAEYKKAEKHLEKLKEEWNSKTPEDKQRLFESELNPSVYSQQMPLPPQVQLIEAGSPEGAFKRMSELPAMTGCALAFDELIRILSLDQYKNQGGDTRQTLMEAWSQPYSIEFQRSDDRNTLSLNKICINITGGIQPTKAKKLLSDPDDGDGLLSRFLIAQTKTPENFAVWSDTQVDVDQALCGLYQFLSELHFDLRQRVYGDDYIQSIVDGEQVILKFDATAQKRWQRWWEHVRDQMQRVEHENPALYGYLGKILSQTLRIALGLHCIELMYEDKADPLTVGLPTLERAIYAAKFHIGQFRLLQANNDTNNLPAQLTKIYQYAQRKGQEISATQVQNTVFKRLERKPSLAQIRENFKQLAEAAGVKLVGAGKDLKILVQKLVGIPTNSDQISDNLEPPQSSIHQEVQSQLDKSSDNSDNFSNRQIDSEATVSQLEVDDSAGGVQEEGSESNLSNHENCRNCRNSEVDLPSTESTEPNVEIEDVSEKLSEPVGISDTTSFSKAALDSELDGRAVHSTVPSGTGIGALAEPKQNQLNENRMPGVSQVTVGARVAHSDPYTVAYSYHGTVESVTGDEVVVRWAERRGKPNERETYNFSDLRLLENPDE